MAAVTLVSSRCVFLRLFLFSVPHYYVIGSNPTSISGETRVTVTPYVDAICKRSYLEKFAIFGCKGGSMSVFVDVFGC